MILKTAEEGEFYEEKFDPTHVRTIVRLIERIVAKRLNVKKLDLFWIFGLIANSFIFTLITYNLEVVIIFQKH